MNCTETTLLELSEKLGYKFMLGRFAEYNPDLESKYEFLDRTACRLYVDGDVLYKGMIIEHNVGYAFDFEDFKRDAIKGSFFKESEFNIFCGTKSNLLIMEKLDYRFSLKELKEQLHNVNYLTDEDDLDEYLEEIKCTVYIDGRIDDECGWELRPPIDDPEWYKFFKKESIRLNIFCK